MPIQIIIANFTGSEVLNSSFNETHVLGCSFCTSWDSSGTWKIAHPFFVYSAVKYNGGVDFVNQERWQQLETITALVFNCSAVTVEGSKGTMEVAKSNTILIQKEIGDQIDPALYAVTMIKLASGHNLIDSIMIEDGAVLQIFILFKRPCSLIHHTKSGDTK
jgi:hypothetical protein